jgi:hypothetical protein
MNKEYNQLLNIPYKRDIVNILVKMPNYFENYKFFKLFVICNKDILSIDYELNSI